MPNLLKDTAAYRLLRRLWCRRFAMRSENRFLRFAPPGHFYSPIPDVKYVQQHRSQLFDRQVRHVDGIAIHADAQRALIERFAQFYDAMPFTAEKSHGLRYHFDNEYFSYGDAISLYSMLRCFQPRRVVEVGSGYSSAVMLDTNDQFLSQSVKFTFIDPNPERLQSLLGDRDQVNHEVIAADVQNVPLDRFKSLEANDVLLIDSSHVVKVGSDVVYLLSVVLPSLNPGVFVHVHDIFWPFEYPEEWILDGRAWNEAYALKAFLQFNSSFEILLFNSYLSIHHKDVLERHLPLFLRNPGGSIWLRRTG
jgi:predicted O-methyltransferase YrrM